MLLLLFDIDGTLLQRASVEHATALRVAAGRVHGVDLHHVHPMHGAHGLAQCVTVFDGRLLQQRPVDVEEEQERLQRLRSVSGASRRAKAAISFAVLAMSSSWTISTAECM